MHVGWSGNSVLRVERDAATGPPSAAASCSSPVRSCSTRASRTRRPGCTSPRPTDGLDGLAASWHAWQRSLPAHPVEQPVVLNVWEAVFFDHDLDRLRGIAERAARVGVERFVLDDGWFRHRRDDTAGPRRLVGRRVGVARRSRSAGRARARPGHAVRPLVRARDGQPRLRPVPRAPGLGAAARGPRTPLLERHQLVLDLTRPEVREHLFERVSVGAGRTTRSTT